jgi:UDP-2,4-diacetamido-2,4,6-trideoxy-beta-L-altropyranose hydrolase
LIPLAASDSPMTGKRFTGLGATWQDDATETKCAIDSLGGRPSWLVADHYGIDAEWERAMRPHTDGIVVIDDKADRPHDCDLLLDQNLVADLESRYDAWVDGAGCRRLLGPKYALLHPAYAELHGSIADRTGPVRRVLISFGGADRMNLTGRFLGAILSVAGSEVTVDVVLSGASPYLDSVRAQAAANSKVRLHQELPTLAPLMAGADLAIGGSGATTWERLSMKLYAIVVTLADNQRSVAEEMERRKLVHWVGDADDLDDAAILAVVQSVIAAPLPPMKMCAGDEVDGRGAERVCREMFASIAKRSSTRTIQQEAE